MEYLKPVQKLVVLSDVHLGRGDPRTGYRGDAAGFVQALHLLAKDADLLILNGDLYDLDRGAIPTAQALEYQHLEPDWREVEDCISVLPIRLTAGNHDIALNQRMIAGNRVQLAYELQVGPWWVRVEHGDRFDALVKRFRRFTSAVTWLSGALSRWQLDPLYYGLRALEQIATDDQSNGVALRAGQWLEQRRAYDVLILGHTHKRWAQRFGDQWLLNPGACMDLPYRYLCINGEDKTVQFGEISTTGELSMGHCLALESEIGKDRVNVLS